MRLIVILPSKQQHRHHPPPFAHQHVERAAGRAGIHDLEANARLEEMNTESRRREDLPPARPEEHDFRFELENTGCVVHAEIRDVAKRIVRPQRRRADDDGVVEHPIVDPQFSVPVTADDVDVRSEVLGEAHTAKIRKFFTGCILSTIHIRFAVRTPGDLRRVPLLERLLADAAVPTTVLDWRGEAFRAIGPPGAPLPPIAAVALHAAWGAVPGSWVCLATPTHVVAGMNGVTMPADGIVDLTHEEAEALAADFNGVFAGAGVRLWVGRSAVLLCAFERALEVSTHDPEELMGCDVFGFRPAGTDAARLLRLMSEMEMWLFDHDVNRTRAARGLRPITGLWLWGGGPLLPAMPMVHGWTAGNDPLFAAFALETEIPSDARSGVVVCEEQPGSPRWPEIEQRWLAPATANLRSGRLDRLELSAGNRCFTVGQKWHRRWWRRPRPWWESFGVESGETNGIR